MARERTLNFGLAATGRRSSSESCSDIPMFTPKPPLASYLTAYAASGDWGPCVPNGLIILDPVKATRVKSIVRDSCSRGGAYWLNNEVTSFRHCRATRVSEEAS